MKPIKAVYVILLISLVELSCNLSEEPGQYDSSYGILPLKTGNTWEYFQQTLDTNGYAIDTSSIIMSVTGPDSIGSFKGYRIRGFFFWIVNPIVFANYPDGLYTANGPLLVVISGSPTNIERAIAFPTFPGDTLTYSGFLIKTRSVNQPITVKAGNFNCIVYDIIKDNHNLGEIWMTPEVGIIKARQQIGYATEVHELQTFKLYF